MSSAFESASREDLLAVIGLLQRQVAAAEARAGAAEARAAELAAADERLTARVVELERRLGRSPGNSLLPPSSVTVAGRRRRRHRRADAGGGVSRARAVRDCRWPPVPALPKSTSGILHRLRGWSGTR
ncbi:DUF6444 domain-containing protein [Streptomyces sp. NPDC001817]|uniref:DUF6444 domain-containing protein n=1 Tax=Streptomyces sp. NPDC001817 TaxID=3154398 RepID=UPI0033223861